MVQTEATEKVVLRLEGWGRLGEALVQRDEREVFVFGGIAGEEVVAEVVKKRRDYTAARVVEVLTPSPHRVTPPCPYFGPCTGCQWQHIDYRHQLQLKREAVVDALQRVGGFSQVQVAETIPSPQEYGYRNHARFTIGPGGVLGFVNRETRHFIGVDRCMIMHPGINRILAQLQGRCQQTTQLSIRYGVGTDSYLVQPALHNTEIPTDTGQSHYEERLGGQTFRIASPSFFQVNTRQAEKVVELIKGGLALSGAELVVDAYSGVGTFAILLASSAGRVIAIEDSASAIADAKANASGIGNLEFVQGRTEEVLARMEERPYGVVLDPPRKGCDPRVLQALTRLAPQRVVYVSCDPATLARDLKSLCTGPFRLENVQPIDMFPQTYHVESVATLSLGKPLEKLVLASASPRRRELISALGIPYEVVPPSADEAPRPHEPAEMRVERLALAKARSVTTPNGPVAVVGADTEVVIDGRCLGKPRDRAHALEMLRALRGREHLVMTGVAVVDGATGLARIGHRTSRVFVRDYAEEEMEVYVASGHADDKAGAYGIQDEDFNPARSVEGCFSNVVGLPVCTLVQIMSGMGYPTESFRVPGGCSSCIAGPEVGP